MLLFVRLIPYHFDSSKSSLTLTVTLELKSDPATLVDVTGVRPESSTSLSMEQIEQLTVVVGNRKASLASVFEISGQPGSDHHIWKGDLKNVNGIGNGLSSGWIQIVGDAGNHVGSQMRGGAIHVSGCVGDYLGAEMQSGLIHVRGNAADFVGAAYAGSQFGQNGGAILIDGSAGNSLGLSMRRGAIAVAGNAGNCCGYLMNAGTIIIGQMVKKNIGLEMIRGTIVLLTKPPYTLEGFRYGGRHQVLVTQLMDRFLNEHGFSLCLADNGPYALYHGDELRGGRGEILIATSS